MASSTETRIMVVRERADRDIAADMAFLQKLSTMNSMTPQDKDQVWQSVNGVNSDRLAETLNGRPKRRSPYQIYGAREALQFLERYEGTAMENCAKLALLSGKWTTFENLIHFYPEPPRLTGVLELFVDQKRPRQSVLASV